MKIWMVVILAVAVLYPTIWPHEVGHGVAPYLYGCKKTFWRTDTSWFLVSSWSDKDIDYQCLSEKGRAAAAWSAFGGTAANPLLLFVLLPVLWLLLPNAARSWWFVAGGRVLLHQAVQRGPLGTVALVVKRCAIRRPLGLPADGLHDGLPVG
jgi:hypothetical protein